MTNSQIHNYICVGSIAATASSASAVSGCLAFNKSVMTSRLGNIFRIDSLGRHRSNTKIFFPTEFL